MISALFLPLFALSAMAQSSSSLDDVAKVALVPGWRTDSGTHMAGLQITLADGWKTYWRAPGDAGIPPQFDWAQTSSIRAIDLYWPTPKVFNLNGYVTLAYNNVVLLPIEIEMVQMPNGPVQLSGQMNFGVCEEICVPVSVAIDAVLPDTRQPNAMILKALADQPTPASKAGVRAVTCKIEPISDGLRIDAKIEMDPLDANEVAVIELSDKTIWVSEASTSRTGAILSATADMVPPDGKPFSLSRSDIRVTVIGDGRAVDIQGCEAG